MNAIESNFGFLCVIFTTSFITRGAGNKDINQPPTATQTNLSFTFHQSTNHQPNHHPTHPWQQATSRKRHKARNRYRSTASTPRCSIDPSRSSHPALHPISLRCEMG
jgi:hypothetical protein